MSDEDQVETGAEPVAEAPEQVPDTETAAEPEAAEPAPSAPETPAYPPVAGEELPPTRSKMGLVVVVASIILLLAAFVIGGPALYSALSKSSTPTSVSDTKAKVTVATGFVEALLAGDTLAIKSYLPDNVQKAITDAQWQELAAQDSTGGLTFSAAKWSGDTTAVVTLAAQDTTGTLRFSVDPVKPLTVVMTADIGGSTEIDTVALVKQGTGYRVVSISNGSETSTFDEALIKSMVASDTVAPETSTTP